MVAPDICFLVFNVLHLIRWQRKPSAEHLLSKPVTPCRLAGIKREECGKLLKISGSSF